MLKKFTIALILFSMTLHCAYRIGLVTYLYQERHVIAQSLGFIEEVPIAVCGQKANNTRSLIIHEKTDQQNPIPVQLALTREIVLFFDSGNRILNPSIGSSPVKFIGNTRYQPFAHQDIALAIFQPPKI